MERIALEVLPADIASGVQLKADSCPISRALTRQLGGRWSTMAVGTTSLGGPDWPVYVPVEPDRFAQFVRDFDSGKPVFPTTFTLVRQSV